MGQRLAIVKRQPMQIIDWWSHLGASSAVLGSSYPRAVVRRVDPAGWAAQATPAAWWSPRRWRRAGQVLAREQVAGASAELLWANMCLHFETDIEALLRRWREAIALDGFLMFSTLGPGSFGTLRSLYREQGWGVPFAPLVDMHDLGDMLVHAGFAEPVMDQESLTLTWTGAAAMLAELRSLGGNAAIDRHQGLRTPRWRERLCNAVDKQRDAQGRVALDFEIVYGHAFCAAPREPMTSSTSIPMERMRAMVRAGRER